MTAPAAGAVGNPGVLAVLEVGWLAVPDGAAVEVGGVKRVGVVFM